MLEKYPAAYLEGMRLFNQREFYECHDVWEELWTETLGEEREFYQGLIQAAVALFHFENGNLGGARRLYESSRNYLSPYGKKYLGIDLEKFLAEMKDCFQGLLNAGSVYPTDVVLQTERIPRLEIAGAEEPPVQE